jgi:hypothetical protein
VKLNATILFTWLVMALLVGSSWLITRHLTTDRTISRGRTCPRGRRVTIQRQIREVGADAPDRYLPFVGTLFLFVALSNTLALVPGYRAPTGSLSTTAALALAVFVAVPGYGIRRRGLRDLPAPVHAADADHAALQRHRRGLPDPGVGGPPVRQRHERRADRGGAHRSRAAVLPDRHAGLRAADRPDPGVHLRGPRARLHRFGHAGPGSRTDRAHPPEQES